MEMPLNIIDPWLVRDNDKLGDNNSAAANSSAVEKIIRQITFDGWQERVPSRTLALALTN